MDIICTDQNQEKEQGQASKPALGAHLFLYKLFDILGTPALSHIIRWADKGDRFRILNRKVFENEVIPIYFRHKSLKSFVRQLHLYEFKKVKTGTRTTQSEAVSYRHPLFQRSHPDLICYIRRKLPQTDNLEDVPTDLVRIPGCLELQTEIRRLETIAQRTECADDSVVRFAENCKNHVFGELILNSLKIFWGQKENKPSARDQGAFQVYQLTKRYIGEVSSLCKILDADQSQQGEQTETQGPYLLRKRLPLSNTIETKTFKTLNQDIKTEPQRPYQEGGTFYYHQAFNGPRFRVSLDTLIRKS